MKDGRRASVLSSVTLPMVAPATVTALKAAMVSTTQQWTFSTFCFRAVPLYPPGLPLPLLPAENPATWVHRTSRVRCTWHATHPFHLPVIAVSRRNLRPAVARWPSLVRRLTFSFLIPLIPLSEPVSNPTCASRQLC